MFLFVIGGFVISLLRGAQTKWEMSKEGTRISICVTTSTIRKEVGYLCMLLRASSTAQSCLHSIVSITRHHPLLPPLAALRN
jgi:hypothetical protein